MNKSLAKFQSEATGSGLTSEEIEIAWHIDSVLSGFQKLGLSANEHELFEAVHTMQTFLLMRVMHRERSGYWSNWFEGTKQCEKTTEKTVTKSENISTT